jgi:hypothetical protein
MIQERFVWQPFKVTELSSNNKMSLLSNHGSKHLLANNIGPGISASFLDGKLYVLTKFQQNFEGSGNRSIFQITIFIQSLNYARKCLEK